jgi:KDO2-lipid IV(A) lauroyltransferase
VVLLKFSTLTADQIRARVEFDGDERVRQALDEGKGVLLFSGHFGYWELQGIAHPLALPPMSVLARPLDNPYCTRCSNEFGARRATTDLPSGAVCRVLRALRPTREWRR